jgi:FAD/FMN-containing dehydrogenase
MTWVEAQARSRFPECEVVARDHPRYDLERRIFNGFIDRRPRAILFAETGCALVEAGRWLLEKNLPFSIRAGGHNVAGSSLIEDGYVLDTSRLAHVAVNRAAMTADVQPGALWRDFDSICAKYRLCTPGGIISDTGVAGLTLGGGIGWLNGICGLTCDNLTEADVLTPSGRVVTASENENFDLLWALRGGGGNFGLVTRFRFRLHPLPSLYAGSVVYRGEGFREAMQRYFECCESASDQLTISFVALTGPGEPRISLDICFAGVSESQGGIADDLLPSKSHTLLKDTRKAYTYVNWQRQLDDDERRGRRSYWRAIYVSDLANDGFLSILERYFNEAPSSHSMLTIDHVHGAAHRFDHATSAYGDRVHKYLFLINTNWDDVKDDEVNLAWCNSLFRDIQPFCFLNTYVNYLSQEGDGRVEAAFGAALPRLRQVKLRYDPENKFCGTQNIRPARCAPS